jgi:hypothetical protein
MSQPIGPTPIPINPNDLIITRSEREQMMEGLLSYNDVLYSLSSPCGPLYAKMKSLIQPNWKAPKDLRNQSAVENSKNGTQSGLPKEFQNCVKNNFRFYKQRKANLDKISIDFILED